ncbi:MAG: celD [Caulobacter sp.]|nr:celD [Caulobacter sp.]
MTRSRSLSVAVAAIALAALAGTAPAQAPGVADPSVWPEAKSQGLVDAKTEAFVSDLMARMSVEEKVGQLIQGDISSIKPDDLRKYPLGSVLAGGDSPPVGQSDRSGPEAWLQTARAFRAVSLEKRAGHTPIPVIFGVDAVHGNNNVVGAVLMPHNIGLGAMRDPELLHRLGEVTARESAVVGFDWAFGPTLAVVRDDRWGRTYEGYSEDPEIVAQYAAPMVTGLQGPPGEWPALHAGHVAASAKHFLGDGGTLNGKDQGDNVDSEADLVRLHAQGYARAIDAGALTIMASFSSWHGVKMHGNKSLLTDVLKGRMGFDGVVVSDWNAHGQVPGCTNVSCPQAFIAGIDMMMAADSWKGLYDNTLAQVKSGQIPMARVDDAVRRILRVKVKAGLFGQRPFEGRFEQVGSADHRALARQAVRESLVLLKNNGGVLPLKASARVLVTGDGADNIAKQAGGWTLSWQGTGNKPADFPGATSIWTGIEAAVKAGGGQAELSPDGSFKTRPDVAVVVFGENPYAEFQGDLTSLEYQPGAKTDLALLKRLKAQGIPVVAVFLSGRPLWTNSEINAADAFVAAWLPGSEGAGVADVLVGDAGGKPRADFRGKLSYSWPKLASQTVLNRGDKVYDPLFAYGYGLTYASKTTLAPLSEVSGIEGAAVATDSFFTAGKLVGPWRIMFKDPGGIVGTGTASPQGILSTALVDAGGVQGGATALTWNGKGEASFAIAGSMLDLSRQANGDMALLIRYRLDTKPTGPVVLNVGRGSVPFHKLFAGASVGEWRTAKIKLSCFRGEAEDLTVVNVPVALTSASKASISVSDLRIAPNQNDSVCP